MRSSVSPQNNRKSKSLTRCATEGLLNFVKNSYPKKIPTAAITALSKVHGKKPLTKQDRVFKRLIGSDADIATSNIVDFLSSTQHHEKGKKLSEEAVKRVFQGAADSDGKIAFTTVLKMFQLAGMQINQKTAKAVVRKYGQRKNYLDVKDCIRINNKRGEKKRSPSK